MGERSSERETLQEGNHRNFATRLLSALNEVVPHGVQLATGLPVQQLENLSLSRSTAAQAERFLFLHEGDLLFAEDIQEQRLIFNPESLREVDLIMEHVENGSPEQVSQSIREAFSQLVKNKTAPELVHIFITQILFRGLSCARSWAENQKSC